MGTSQPNLYDMGARITALLSQREAALTLLRQAPLDKYVLGAIEALTNEPFAGDAGGPAREAGDLRMQGTTLRVPRAVPAPRSAPTLTPRQADCVRLAARGYNNRHIAKQLTLSLVDVRQHIRSVMDDHELASRRQLCAYAVAVGLA